MELKEGYKQTEVGVIPEDWDVRPLAYCVQDLQAGVSVNSTQDNSGHQYILKTSAVHDGKVDTTEIKSVCLEDIKRLKTPLEADCIVISRMNTPELVGASGYTPASHSNIFLPDRLWKTIKNNRNKTNFKWLSYLLNSKKFRYVIKDLGTGTSGSMKNIAKEKMLSLLIPLPNFIEQKAIASALSDVDALLSSLDALIAKKRGIKTAAMQELLTGKKRLPGFSGEWKKAFAYEYGEFIRGVSYNPDRDLSYKNKENTFILLRANNINNNYINFSEIYYINKDIVNENQILLDGDILFCMSNGSKRLVGKSASYGGTFSNAVTFGAFMGVLRPNGNSNKSFLKYIFQTNMFISYINIILAGSAINNLTPANILNFDFLIPSDSEEQAAIAAVLSDMDAEIGALESRRAKTLALKQGMMQELLTGRTRLLPEGERHG